MTFWILPLLYGVVFGVCIVAVWGSLLPITSIVPPGRCTDPFPWPFPQPSLLSFSFPARRTSGTCSTAWASATRASLLFPVPTPSAGPRRYSKRRELDREAERERERERDAFVPRRFQQRVTVSTRVLLSAVPLIPWCRYALSCPVVSCHVMPSRVVSCYVMSRHVMPSRVMSRLVLSCHVM